MYREIACTQEQLIPTRWVCRSPGPDRETIAQHVMALYRQFGYATAKECIARMLWIGIIPSNRNRWS